MCFKEPPQSKTERDRAKRDLEARRRPDSVNIGENTTPRGNGEADDHDIERSLERLTALVGR